jgi:hypothetical protein
MGARRLPGKLLRVRLPEDHWVWTIKDPEQRSLEVKAALDIYHRFAKNIETLCQTVEELKTMLQQGAAVVVPDPKSKDASEEDPRFAALDKFLEF